MNIRKGAVVGVAALSLVTGVQYTKAQSMTMPSNTMSMTFQSNLGVGAWGDEVSSIQTFLEGQGYFMLPMGATKGYFGEVTKKAVMDYQAAEGLPSTGYFGPITRAHIASKMMMSTNTTNNMMNNEKGVMVGGSLMVASLDIVDNAVKADNVTTLVAAVKAAGLVETLKGTGPFTVFAPTNAAFAKLPAGTVEMLVKPENKAKLTDILTYHVVAGTYTSANLTDGLTLKTVEGKSLTFKRADGKLWINGSAMVETADVISKNGVTHVIDTVLMPQ